MIERGLKPGETRAIGPVSVWNTGAEPLELGLSWQKPLARELEDGYEPIPDTDWLSWETERGRVAPDGRFEATATLRVPERNSLRGKRYQAHWSVEGLTPAGSRLEARPKLLLRVPGKRKSFEERRRSRPRAKGVAFAASASVLKVEPVALGPRVELGREGAPAFTLTNTGPLPATVHLEVEEDLPGPPPSGYRRVPDPEFLSLSRELVALDPGESRSVKLSVKVPREARYLGRRWAFTVLLRALEAEDPGAQAARIWVLVGVEEPTLLNTP